MIREINKEERPAFATNNRNLALLNPLVPEFKIPAEPINTGDKMTAPRREPISLRITLYNPFLQPKRLQ